MKKRLFFSFWMVLLAGSLAAQTIEVSGEYQGHVLWDADTIKVMGDVVVEPNDEGSACLTVARGTYVIAEGYYSITVHNGSLYALGAEKIPVVFTARNTADFNNPDAVSGWRGLHLITDQSSVQDTLIMEYCWVSYGKILSSAPEGERFGAGIQVQNKKYCYFNQCRFTHNHACYNGDLPTDGGGGAMYVIDPGTFLVEHCYFSDNYAWWGASICVGGLRHMTVRNCEFYNNTGHYGTALDMHLGEVAWYSQGPRVYHNYIHGNHGNTAYLGWDVSIGHFHDNIIVNNEGYSPVLGTTAPNYSHYYNNTIANNQSDGFIYGQGSGIWTCGQQKIYNNVFYGNSGICFHRMDPTHADPTAFNNCSASPSGVAGTDDVYGDPQFVNPTLGLGPAYDQSSQDWSLQETSPCINTGSTDVHYFSLYPEFDIYGNPRRSQGRIDIGAVEFFDPEGIGELVNTSIVTVYPNPGKSSFNFSIAAEKARVEIYNLDGHKIVEKEITGNQLVVDAEFWPSGMYFWKVYSSSELIGEGKWVKE